MVLAPVAGARATEAAGPREGATGALARDVALDIVKGLLVVAMVVYHWLNIFVTADGNVYRYLRFVTPSFIFVAGYLVTAGYLQKYRAEDPALSGRLLVRGVKVLGMFIALNLGVGIMAAVTGGDVRAGLVDLSARAASMLGTGGAKRAAFEVLAPIGYLLVGAAGLLWSRRLHRSFLLGLLGVGAAVVYAGRGSGWDTSTPELLAMGVLGMLIGRVSRVFLDRLAGWPWGWVAAYAAYAVAVERYDVVFELQVVGLVITMMLLYIVAGRLEMLGNGAAPLVLLGQYSLLAYVVHIAILRGWARVAGSQGLEPTRMLVAFGVALLGTWGVLALTRWTRRRWPQVDRLYRAVFA